MAKIDKSLETAILQLESLFPHEEARIKIFQREFKLGRNVTGNNCNLYKLLHETRLFDSFLRLYLENVSEVGNKHSLGDYLLQLSKSTTRHKAINDQLRIRYRTEIVDNRNSYMHAAGRFPTKSEVLKISQRIHECLQVVLGNHIS